MNRIKDTKDVISMLDHLFRSPAPWWNKFYEDKSKGVPFFIDYPDENLVSYFNSDRFKPINVLELGSGNGRNAIYMTEQGCRVDAVDISQEAVEWARNNAISKNVSVNFICGNVFELELDETTYDLVYDSGLLHHLVPHQRFKYIDIINRVLKPNGLFGIVCFADGFEEISGVHTRTDESIYRVYSMQGGIAYTQEDLREILSDHFEEVEIRHMKECSNDEKLFGKGFLWASLWKRKS
ncbi:class I SAM-dependent methyltransferase [Paenibacillus glacialis]|uniref:Methyltransferase domain-containing protein n=1 Tax=Paenibacillus glacialis TaxID=494026 RepID=A0A162M4S1_9BACL|nr:class I SAM-dependent methyltransferase [Paenibacillus glacialis]OAB38383.1 hypothetical protein PGLA_20005 [Paenibacillus glacialis]